MRSLPLVTLALIVLVGCGSKEETSGAAGKPGAGPAVPQEQLGASKKGDFKPLPPN